MINMENGLLDTRKMTYMGDSGNSLKALQEFLGKRPGNYRVDPYYVRYGINHKPYFWNDYERRWELMRIGDKFKFDEYGIAVRETTKQ